MPPMVVVDIHLAVSAVASQPEDEALQGAAAGPVPAPCEPGPAYTDPDPSAELSPPTTEPVLPTRRSGGPLARAAAARSNNPLGTRLTSASAPTQPHSPPALCTPDLEVMPWYSVVAAPPGTLAIGLYNSPLELVLSLLPGHQLAGSGVTLAAFDSVEEATQHFVSFNHFEPVQVA